MAVSNCSRICRQCGSRFVRSAKGQPTKYCSEQCKHVALQRWNRADYARRNLKTCEVCAKPYVGIKRRRWCSAECKRAAEVAALKPPRERNPANHFNCKQCGNAVYRKWANSPSKLDRLPSERHCSKACARRSRSAEAASRRLARNDSRHVDRRIRAEIAALRNMATRSIPDRRHCQRCGSAFARLSLRIRLCKECKASTHRAQKLRHKAIRRARIAIDAEMIDPILVFEAQGWRCQLCGVWTPRELRGTNSDNAPELDHIIPLARGGRHVRSNVQCACRKCNGIKGSGGIAEQIAA
jgi:5-methylcytosine-specific restriction endonuclease McrA/endogenous inhibitor of DNA gyrase (YacG/DUF329 family)